MRVACVGLLVAFLAGPTVAEGLSCFSSQHGGTRNELQERLLSQSRHRASSLCTQPKVQCHFSLLDARDGEIRIAVELAVIDGKRCLYPLDAGHMDVYSAKGKFIRQLKH